MQDKGGEPEKRYHVIKTKGGFDEKANVTFLCCYSFFLCDGVFVTAVVVLLVLLVLVVAAAEAAEVAVTIAGRGCCIYNTFLSFTLPFSVTVCGWFSF